MSSDAAIRTDADAVGGDGGRDELHLAGLARGETGARAGAVFECADGAGRADAVRRQRRRDDLVRHTGARLDGCMDVTSGTSEMQQTGAHAVGCGGGRQYLVLAAVASDILCGVLDDGSSRFPCKRFMYVVKASDCAYRWTGWPAWYAPLLPFGYR